MKKIILMLAVALTACSPKAEITDTATLASPDGELTMNFILEDGVPKYSLKHKDTEVVLPSRLGFDMRGTVKAEQLNFEGSNVTKSDVKPGFNFDRDFELVGTATDSFEEDWTPVWGEESTIHSHYNELLVQLKQKDSNRLLNIRFRLFDDGLGFRYEFPQDQDLVYFVIKEELTEFAMAEDCFAWWIPGDYDTQEYEYEECRLSEIEKNFRNFLRGNSSQTPFSTSGVQTPDEVRQRSVYQYSRSSSCQLSLYAPSCGWQES